MEKRKITLRDVAELAKVSIGTASQALNNKGEMLPETRERVIQATIQLGYDQRFSVEEYKPDRANTIMVIKHDSYDRPGIDPFYFPVIAGIEKECQKHHLAMMYTTVEVDHRNRAHGIPQAVFSGQIDGIIVVGAYLDDMIARIGDWVQKPIVLVNAYAPGHEHDSVVIDNQSGAFNAVHHLIHNGHQHIGLIGYEPRAHPSIQERYQGYLMALKQNNITSQYIEEGLLKRDAAYRAVQVLLKKFPEITGVFVCNDNAAIGAINGAIQVGCTVPDDLSVVGFDDIDFAQEMVPPLTTIHVDKMAMGAVAVRQLLARVENPDEAVTTTTIQTELVIRRSVRNLKRQKRS